MRVLGFFAVLVVAVAFLMAAIVNVASAVAR